MWVDNSANVGNFNPFPTQASPMKKIILRIIYWPPINWWIRNNIYLFNRIFGTRKLLPVSGIMRLRVTRDVRFKMAINESSFGYIYFYDDPYNYEFTPILLELFRKCNVFYDIGANLGFYTALANEVNPACTVYAFEPSKGPFHYLSRNARINHWKNTHLEALALSDHSGSTTFYEEYKLKYSYLRYHLSGIGTLEKDNPHKKSDQYEVKLSTLDDFRAAKKTGDIDLIKMDTEGTEILILEGGKQEIFRSRPIIICEILPGNQEIKYEQFFSGRQYQIFRFENTKLVPVTTIVGGGNQDDRNFFFVPDEKVEWVRPFILK
jgi:FkbM family methyltransferase